MRKILVGLVSAVLATVATVAVAEDAFPPENRRFSGVAQVIELTEPGNWQLTSLHGRVLATGNVASPGSVNVLMEDLRPGATVTAKLTVDGRDSGEYKFYSHRQLHGMKADFSALPLEAVRELEMMGLADPNAVKEEGAKPERVWVKFDTAIPANFVELSRDDLAIVVVMPRRYELPMEIPPNFSQITLFAGEFAGSLSVVLEKDVREVSSVGGLSMVRLEFEEKPTLLLMTPDLDMSNVNVILSIKNNIIEELSKNEK